MYENEQAEERELKLFWDAVSIENDKTNTCITKTFFDEFNLDTYLNHSAKNIVQLGASSGLTIAEYKLKGWNVVAYDYSIQACQLLNQKGMKTRLLDLNYIEKSDQAADVSYRNDLNEDLQQISNIFLVRVLQFLKPETVPLLLSALCHSAQPGSVYVIVNKTFNDDDEKEIVKEDKCKSGYVFSFFKQRKDMEMLLNTTTASVKSLKNLNNSEVICEGDDEVLVFRKN